MPAYPLRALVLRKTKLGEADLILTLLAADGRQVRAVAKGARKPTSRLGARVEPYTVLDLLLHTGRNLHVIAEARTEASHEALRSDLDRLTHAAVVADVLDKASVEGQTDERLFGLAMASLDALETSPVGSLLAITLGFLVKAMAMIGYRPQLASCVECGAEAGSAFALESGGVVCTRCEGRVPGTLPVSAEALRALSALLAARMAEIPSLAIPEAVQRECFGIVRAFVATHMPARLKALEYLASTLR